MWQGEEFLDGQIVPGLLADQSHGKKVDEHRHAYRQMVNRIEEAFRKQYYAHQYERFLDDYADPSLWEGHKKTLTVPSFPISSSQPSGGAWDRGGSFFKETLFTALAFLHDRRIDVTGLTLTQVRERATAEGLETFDLPEIIENLVVPTPKTDD